MLLRNNVKNENIPENNQSIPNFNVESLNYNVINDNECVSLNFKEYNSNLYEFNQNPEYKHDLNDYNRVTNQISTANISMNSMHSLKYNNINPTQLPILNHPSENMLYPSPVSSISCQQYYNFSSSSIVYPNNMNTLINHGIEIQQNIVSTTTLMSNSSNSQSYDGLYTNFNSQLSPNNSNPTIDVNHQIEYSNTSHFNRSFSHTGFEQNPPNIYQNNVIPEISPLSHLSHSFNDLNMKPSLSPNQWNTYDKLQTDQVNQIEHNHSVIVSNKYMPNTTIHNKDTMKFENQFSNLNSSSRSLPQSCQKSKNYSNKNLLNIPSSISISTPAVVPTDHKSNFDNVKYIKSNLSPIRSSEKNNLFSGNNLNNLTPSRRMIDVMEERMLIPPTGIMNPIPNLMHITKKPNCSPNIMRCTLNSVPCNEDILNKTRLPLAILIYPFKDLANLQVIRSKKIIRCRTLSCRAYLNPFVTFTDQKRWKCNLCQRTNELTDEFMYDESMGMYIESHRRAEVRLATVEYIAPREYSMKASQVPVYVFMVDISVNSIGSLYVNTMSRILNSIDELLERFPGHQHAKFALIGYDKCIHFYPINEKKCQELVLSDISSPIEIPITTGILVDIHKYKDQIQELLLTLLENVENEVTNQSNTVPNCLGSAIMVAKQLINGIGGRITIFNSSCPSIGEGILTIRDSIKSNTIFPIAPDKEFYKSLSLECAQSQIGVDIFQLGMLPCDLASLSVLTRYCGGSLFYYPDLSIQILINNKENVNEDDKNVLEIQRLLYDLNRYLTRKIGFDSVLRVRYSSGFTIQSSHGNFFARACDLYSMANVNPDSGIAVRLGISDNFIDNNVVFFQAALLYTSSHGERRIRVHTLCLPVSSQIDDVFRMADQQTIAGFLAKSVSDRLRTNGKVIDAREALINAIVDPSIAFGEFCLSSSQRLTSLPFPYYLRLLPLYVWGILQSKCLLSTQNNPDCSVAILDSWRSMPLPYLLIDIYPTLYNITSIANLSTKQKEKFNSMLETRDQSDSCSISEDPVSNIDDTVEQVYSSDSEASSWDSDACDGISCYDSKYTHSSGDHEIIKPSDNIVGSDEDDLWYPEQLHLTMQSLKRTEVYLLESSQGLIMLMGSDTPALFFRQIFGVDSLFDLPTNGNISLPELNNAASAQLRIFIKELQIERPIGSHLFIINDNHSNLNHLFQSLLLEDDKLDTSYHRFLKYIQRKVNI